MHALGIDAVGRRSLVRVTIPVRAYGAAECAERALGHERRV